MEAWRDLQLDEEIKIGDRCFGADQKWFEITCINLEVERHVNPYTRPIQRKVSAVGCVRRRVDEGHIAECPLCGSLDVGGAHDNVHCYGCGLNITKEPPLQNAIDAWNMRGGKSLDADMKQL